MSGALAGSQRHVVIVRIDGPKTQAQYEAFKEELEALLKKHKARVVLKARTKKSSKGA
jgi:hypothetical protein